jgi:hypothetical protein
MIYNKSIIIPQARKPALAPNLSAKKPAYKFPSGVDPAKTNV